MNSREKIVSLTSGFPWNRVLPCSRYRSCSIPFCRPSAVLPTKRTFILLPRFQFARSTSWQSNVSSYPCLSLRIRRSLSEKPGKSGSVNNSAASDQNTTSSSAKAFWRYFTNFKFFLKLLRSMAPDILAGYCLAILIVPYYVVDVIKCDGPSMLPTLQPQGDVILVEKISHHLCGIADGCKGEERARISRQRQRINNRQERMQQQGLNSRTSVQVEDQQELQSAPNNGRPDGDNNSSESVSSWSRLYRRLTTGLSAGDVVVVEHPLRDGTVCKRIIALPGDVVIRRNNDALGSRRSIVVIPDGHVWIEGDNKKNSTDSRFYGPVPCALVVGRVVMRLWPLRGSALMERQTNVASKYSASDEKGPDEEELDSIVIPAGRNGDFLFPES